MRSNLLCVLRVLCGSFFFALYLCAASAASASESTESQPGTFRTAGRGQTKPVYARGGPLGKLLNQWYAEGTAAGNTGDSYDNRDNGHSNLNTDYYFPQLGRIAYSKETPKLFGWGVQRRLLDGVVFGNSSTSDQPTRGGSNPRQYYRWPSGLAFLYQQYRHNNLYVYPEHRDYDPGRNGRGGGYGDLYPTNTPYLIISQGSSGSDQIFLQAIASTLAAFRPEVKRRLIKEGLLMPTFQMIFRLSNKNVQDAKTYLSHQAHPTVFFGGNVDALKMVQIAHQIQLKNVPPMIQLKVLEEDQNVVGEDFFEPPQLATEHLANTPAAIARVVRGPQYVRRMVVSAAGSFDLNRKKLTYYWIILRGDPKKIRILPKNQSRSIVELRVPYHPRGPIHNGDKMESNRVDIGAFVHNGSYYSAPGFVTFFTIDRERRTYAQDGHLVEIDYTAGSSVIDHAAVIDWAAFLRAILDPRKSLGRQLLRERLRRDELMRILKIASEYRPIDDHLKTSKKNYENTLARMRLQQNAVGAAQNRLASAEKVYHKDPTGQNKRAFDAARAEHLAATKKYNEAKKPLAEFRKVSDQAQNAANQFLLDAKIDRINSAADRLLAVLNAIKDDVTFLTKHAERIQELAESPAAKRGTPSIKSLIDELVELGVVKKSTDGLALNPLRAGASPATARLTGFERDRLQRVNLEIMNQLLFAEFLDQPYTENTCDIALTAAKPWRDFYHFAQDGTCIGWTRFIGAKTIDFNAAGYMIIQRDALGRAKKARSTTYRGHSTKPHGRLELECLAGDEIIEYTYQSPSDFVGTISARTKIDKQARQQK